MNYDIIDLSSPVKKKEDFVPFKSHLQPQSYVLDLCSPTPAKTRTENNVLSLLSQDSKEDASEGDVLINDDTVEVEDQSSGILHYVPLVESYRVTEPAPAPIATENVSSVDASEAKRRFFANLDAKKRQFTQTVPFMEPTPVSPVKKPKLLDPTTAIAEDVTATKPNNCATTIVTANVPSAKPKAATRKKVVDKPANNAGSSSDPSSIARYEHPASMVTSSSSSLTTTNSFLSSSTSPSAPFGYIAPVVKVMVPLTPGVEWEVVLIIDKRERSNPIIQGKLVECNIPCELSNLAVGDFLWIARPRQSSYSSSSSSTNTSTFMMNNYSTLSSSTSGGLLSSTSLDSEDSNSDSASYDEIRIDVRDMGAVVLDCIAERKQANDLGASITDRRYEEQKVRLRACGVRTCIYLVEGDFIGGYQKKITSQHIKTAMIETHAEGNMHVLKTRNFDHTIDSLKALHWQVVRRFKRGGCGTLFQTFPNFQKLWGKKSAGTYRQLFGHQLHQLQGCSKFAALPIVNAFGSTYSFIKRLETLGKVQGIKTISELMKVTSKEGKDRKVGKAIAERIWKVYMENY